MSLRGEIVIRPLNEEERPSVEDWWVKREETVPPFEIARTDRGVVVEDKWGLIAVGFAVLPKEVPYVVLDFFQTNPRRSWYAQGKGYLLLVEAMKASYKRKGYMGAFGFVEDSNKRVQRFVERSGGAVIKKKKYHVMVHKF